MIPDLPDDPGLRLAVIVVVALCSVWWVLFACVVGAALVRAGSKSRDERN